MARYGMVIDLKKCVGCNACVVACKAEHNAPTGILQTLVLEREIGRFPACNRVFVPVLCNHCESPACCEVCPTGATYRREDGIVMMDYEKCIGCLACVEHCPYQARSFVEDHRAVYFDGTSVFERPVHDPIPSGVVTKCDFCHHRVAENRKPACCEVCPTEARIFGDLEDPGCEASRQLKKHNGWQMLPDAGTAPRVYYIG